MSLEDLKKKIESLTSYIFGPGSGVAYGFRQNTPTINFTDSDYNLYYNDEISGKFDVSMDYITGGKIPSGSGPIEGAGDYKIAFENLAIISINQKNYENLTYNELRYAIGFLDESSDEFKKVVENIESTDLGVLFQEFSFNNFDVAVSLKVNSILTSGKGILLTKLPTFKFARESGEGTNWYSTFGGFNVTHPEVVLKAETYDELIYQYEIQNGSSLILPEQIVNFDSNLQLKGNLSTNTTEFSYSENRMTNILQIIGNLFIDFKTPSGILKTSYKSFLVDSLGDPPTTIQSKYESQVETTAADISFYLMYDFESDRRYNLVFSARELGLEASAEDILNAAEAAALNDLAESGLVGEGGITTQQEAVDPEQAQRFYEQCVLLAKMEDIKKTFNSIIREEGDTTLSPPGGKEKMHQPSPYQGRFYMVEAPEGKNQRLLNFLSAPRGNKINDFLSLTPDIQAFLTPKLRLFKVFNLIGGDLQQVEFIFKNTTSANTKLRKLFQDDSKFFRGSGYGIKNFSFSFNGTTPATAKNDITADLTLFFQDFSDFVTEHKTTEGTFKFVDLIFYDKKNENNPTYGYGSSHPDQYSPAYYRIRADVGWNVPEDNPQFDDACRKRGLDPDNIRDVIESTNRSYYLNMVEHDLDFKKDGTVEIKAQYRGYVESVLKGTDMDALVDSTILAKRASRADIMKTAERDCTPGEIARIKRIYAAEELKIIKETRQRFFDRLRELNKVHTYRVDYDGGFRVNGYFEEQPRGDVDNGAAPSPNVFNFYFLGDLLYVMLDTMYENSTVAPSLKTKFIIPSIDFEAFFEGSNNFTINIAQIPIADRYFEEWWTENVVKEDRRSFPIMFFMRKLLNDLVANALVDVCLNRDYQRSFNFQTTSLNAAGDPLAPLPNKDAPVILLDTDIVPFTMPEGTKINDIMNYVVVYPAYSTTLPIGSGDYTEDLENAVYHFHLGQDRGIVNEVKFSKVDMQYIREARYKREGIDGLLQLGAVYSANLQMFGNTLFYPGMQIFINPFGIGGEEFLPNKSNTIANKLGLGGYHLITKVNSSIASGLFKTTIDAQFIYSGDGDVRVIKQGKQDPNAETPIEEAPDTDPTCNRLVKAVEDDYRNLTRTGTASNLAAEAAIDLESPETSLVSEQTSEEIEAQNFAADGQTSESGFSDIDGDGFDDITGLDDLGFPPQSEQ